MADAAVDTSAPTGDTRTQAVPTALPSQGNSFQSGASIFGGDPTQMQSGASIFGQSQRSPAQTPQLQSGSAIFGSPDKLGASVSALNQKFGITPENMGSVSDMAKSMMGMVGKVMGNTVGVPMRAVTTGIGLAAKGAGALGVPTMTELSQKLNPSGQILPDSYFHDITDFYIDKASQAAGVNQMGSMARGIVETAKVGAGLLADTLLDPLRLAKFGALTPEAAELSKIGDTSAAAGARNLVSIPSAGISVPMKTVQPALDMMAQSPVGKIIRALSPDTGIEALDVAGNNHDAQRRGGVSAVQEGYLKPMADKNFTPEEKALITHLGESTPNLQPNVDPEIIKAAGGKISANEAEVKAVAAKNLPEAAKSLGIEVAPGRDQAVVDGVLAAKQSGARYNENMVKAGFITKDNVFEKTIENHMPHEMDPQYHGIQGSEQVQEAVNTEKPSVPGPLSANDITKLRKMTGSVADLNQEILEKTGMKDFFITDPHVATAIREVRSQKLLNDKNYLDVVSRAGENMSPSEARNTGMVPILHPDLQDKGLFYSKDVAAKVSDRIRVPSVTSVGSSLGKIGETLSQSPAGNLNRIARATVFTSPGIFMRNALDNFVKAIARGTSFESFGDARDLLNGKSEGFTSAPNLLNKNGIIYSGEDLKNILGKSGLLQTSSFREGMGNLVDSVRSESQSNIGLKSLLTGKTAAEYAEKMMGLVSKFGEKGENLSKAALFLERLKQGYTPEMANREVTKFMFDYTRNSPAMNFTRFFSPFIQHPIKTALISPELVGSAPALYNAIQNTWPKVLGNAFNDPTTQAAIKQLLPANLQGKDPIMGPLLPGNTWLGAVLGAKPGQQVVPYLAPSIGTGILQHFDYFSDAARKAQSDGNFGLSPLMGAALRAIQGKDNFGKQLPSDGTARLNYVLREGILGNIAMPETFKLLKQTFGIGDPQYYEPPTVMLMKALGGQLGGVSNLDSDTNFKMIALAHTRAEIMKQGMDQAHTEMRNMNQGQYTSYVKENHGSIIPATNQEIYAETVQKMQSAVAGVSQQQQQTMASQSLVKGQISAAEFASKIKNIDDNVKKLNEAYRFGAQRYLQMSSGAKNSQDARAKAGVGVIGN